MASAWKGDLQQIALDRPFVAARQGADQADGFIPIICVGDCCDDLAGASNCPGEALRLLQVVTVKGILDQAVLKQCGLFESTGEGGCVVGQEIRWISVLRKLGNRQAYVVAGRQVGGTACCE